MIALVAGALAASWPLAVPLDHDLFTTGAAAAPPAFRMARTERPALPDGLDVDPARAPDAALVPAAGLRLAVGRPARTLQLVVAAQGALDSRGIAADGEVSWADGRVQKLKWMVGEQVWPAWAGATGRRADVVPLGENVGGDAITAALLTVDLSWPDATIEAVRIAPRPGGMVLALLAAAVSDTRPADAHVQADRTPFSSYSFPIPSGASPLSFHNAIPGFLGVRDGHLAWPDGARARFWGVSMVGPAALPDDPDAVARALRQTGFNLVRPHHLDTEKALLDPERGRPGHGTVRPEALDAMDRFHAALAREGIATWLDLWTLRGFLPGEGPPFPDGVRGGNKDVVFFWPEWRAAQKAWFRLLYDRVNPHTGRRYADDPAVAVVEIANENSLLVSWSGGNLEKLPGPHRRRLDALWNEWLRARYGADGRIEAAWAGPSRGGLQEGETLVIGSIAREPATRARTELYPTARAADLVHFYQELEHDYFAEMSTFVRRDLGFRVPIVCTTSFSVSTADAQLGACDVVDLHLYWDPIAETHVFTDASLLASPGRFLEKLAGCQEGLPCTLSEIQHTWPNRHAQEAPMLWAALAARQDLDLVAWFAWSHGAFRPAPDGPDGALDLEGRFDAMALLPFAAALYREALVPPAPARFVRWWSPDALVRDLAEASGLWLDELVHPGSVLARRVRSSFAPRPPPAPATPWVLGPEPVRWTAGRLTIETPSMQALVGEGEMGVSSLRVAGAPCAAFVVRAEDGRALGDSDHVLLAAVGRTEREGTLWAAGGPNPLVVGTGPARLQQLGGALDLRLGGRSPVAVALRPDGSDGEALRLTRLGGGWWRLDLATLRSPWVRVRPRR